MQRHERRCAAPLAGRSRWLAARRAARSRARRRRSQLTGTLAKVRASRHASRIGHRESSIPFSYLSARGEPIGYSIDLCKLLVDAIGEAVGREHRDQVAAGDLRSRASTRSSSGQVDLECGSTTNNLERQKLVAFSPTIFVSGTKLLVKKGSPIQLVPRPGRQDGRR